MKIFVCLALIAVASANPRYRRGVIHDHHESEGDAIGASTFHHEVEHEHAKSHQSVKFEHFHPVPVYVKKEHSHLLKHPLEKGKSEHGIKLLHPKTEHQHGYGLVLDEHRSDLHENHGYGSFDKNDDISDIEHVQDGHHELAAYSHGEGYGEGSEQVASYEPKGIQEEEQYEYHPNDFSQGHEEGYASYH